jgi:hypothetical protein
MADVNWPYMMRRQNTAAWTADTVALLSGEPGTDTTTGEMAIGDGATLWPALDKFTPGTSTDADAIHDNVSGEIAAVALKATPVYDDLLLIEDSAASNAKKKVAAGAIVEQHVLNASASDRNMLEATGGGAPVRVKGLTNGDGIAFSNVTGNVRGDLDFSAADRIWYGGVLGAPTETNFTAFARTLLDDANAAAVLTTLGLSANGQSLVAAANYAAMRALLDLEAGTDFNAYSTKLAAIEALTWAADKGVVLTGANTLATFDLSTFARSILDDANAAAVLATIGAYANTTPLDMITAPTNDLAMNSLKIRSMADPVNPQDASTKAYADLKLAKASNLSDLASAATALTNLGGTDIGKALFTVATPAGARFVRLNADGTITLRTTAEVLSDIGAQASGTYLAAGNNLSDLGSAATARNNLEVVRMVRDTVGSGQTTTSTTLADITGLSAVVPANAHVNIRVGVLFEVSSASGGIGLGINGSAAALYFGGRFESLQSAGNFVQQLTVYNSTTNATTVPVLNTVYYAEINAELVNGASASTITPQIARGGSGTLTIRAASLTITG